MKPAGALRAFDKVGSNNPITDTTSNTVEDLCRKILGLLEQEVEANTVFPKEREKYVKGQCDDIYPHF